jgi:trk system potassium uptake protein TrkH
MDRERGYPVRSAGRTFRVLRARSWRVWLPVIPEHKTASTLSLRLVYGFLGLIAIGAILLMLPISNAAAQFTSPVDAFFTATSAVCVTGLVVVDTGTYWSSFGQGVILALVQIGGFGFMTSATLLLLAFGRRIGLQERLLIGESMGLARLGGVVRIVKRMAIFTLLAEGIGAAIFFFRFLGDNPLKVAAWESVFHSISAFNNAGFDIFGNFQSLTNYQGDYLVVLVTAALIFLGGISFIVIADVLKVRSLTRLSLDSKLVLATTLALLTVGTFVLLFTGFSEPATFGDVGLPQKALSAFFQSVAARTGGFTVIHVGGLTHYALFFIMFLMFVGGASGSTAGGIKVNTFGILVATIWSTIRGREHAEAFGREFSIQQLYRAIAVLMLSLGLVALAVFLLTVYEEFSFISLLFETVSAFGTVGFTTGITPQLSIVGRLIITVTMFIGRLGPLALSMALLQRQRPSAYRYPEEMVRIG